MKFYTAAITLILVLDPLGNIPIFLSLLKHCDPKRQNYIILRESLIAFMVLCLFLFFGPCVLDGLRISPYTLAITGGIILFMIAIRMVFPARRTHFGERLKEPFIVPLAIPLIAGPTAMAVVMLFAANDPSRLWSWFLAIVIAFVVFIPIVLSSRFLMRVLKEKGLVAMERLMGMVLLTVAVQMFLSGIAEYLKSIGLS